MRCLITGGCGFLGSNLAAGVLRRNEPLVVFDSLRREGAVDNLAWLREEGRFDFLHGDVRLAHDVERAVKTARPDVVFHVAGQVAMTTSIDNPRRDFETNVLGTINMLEAVRAHAPEAVVVYSSTNKVYGDLDDVQFDETPTRYVARSFPHGFDEKVPLDFRSPYGCSKGAADQYMLDYKRVFGLKTLVFRHSSIFGWRQFSTVDQGWTGWFIAQALATRAGSLKEPFTISGDGKQVRDVLFASDLVSCYFDAVRCIDRTAGQAYNIGGGVENSLSLLELFDFLETELSVKLTFTKLPWRQSDQKVFIADIRKAARDFKWKPQIGKVEGLRRMIEWVTSRG